MFYNIFINMVSHILDVSLHLIDSCLLRESSQTPSVINSLLHFAVTLTIAMMTESQ